MNDHDVITVMYLVKYALTKGIERVLVSGIPDRITTVEGAYCLSHFYVGTEIFYEREDALEKAESMRVKRIESLTRQIEKLEKKIF